MAMGCTCLSVWFILLTTVVCTENNPSQETCMRDEPFEQTIGIPMGTNCAPLLADLFLHSYEADFLQSLLDKKDRKLALSFNLTFRYIDDVLSLNNPRFGDYLHLIYPKELEETSVKREDVCNYKIEPLTNVFGAKVEGITLKSISQECATNLKEEAFMYRFLLLKNQTLAYQDQIQVTSLFGIPFEETSAVNRPSHPKTPDPRTGLFSNDYKFGLPGAGIEGWHIDGNSVEKPHLFTFIYCISANSNGPTLIVPLKEIVDMLSDTEREYLETILFVSAFNSVQIPLLYKHPFRNDDTIMLALGSLSGQYLQMDAKNPDLPPKIMSVEETQYIKDILHAKILASNLIYAVNYEPGDFLMLQNPSVAHVAGPGTQISSEISGLRLILRTSVTGVQPSKNTTIDYHCKNYPPFENGYCLFSLKGSVYYPRIGYFDDFSNARRRCKNINKYSDLAEIYTFDWNEVAEEIIRKTQVPHYTNASNPRDSVVLWNLQEASFTNWDNESGQPNDHDGSEDCVVIGPNGKWFDLPCTGPKTDSGHHPAPVMNWNGVRQMRNVYPLCGVKQDYLRSIQV